MRGARGFRGPVRRAPKYSDYFGKHTGVNPWHGMPKGRHWCHSRCVFARPGRPGTLAREAGITTAMTLNRFIRDLDSPRSPLHWWTFAILLAAAVAVRLVAFQGYASSDARSYAMLANDLAHGTLNIGNYDGPAVFPLRIGVYAPAAAIINQCGLSESTIVAYPFAVSLLGCLLAYGMTRYLATPLAGIIALGASAILPIDVSLASRLLPDAVAAFWANVALAFVFAAMGGAAKQWHVLLLGCAGGFFLGMSWLCKETVTYLVPFLAILVLVIYRERSWRSRIACGMGMAAGFASILAVESALYSNLTGDPLFRLHEISRNFKQCAVWFFDEASADYGWKNQTYTRALIDRLCVQGPKSILFQRSMAFVPTIAILGALWMRLFFPDFSAIPGVWLLSLVFMFNFMTTSFALYRPLPLFDRYLYPLMLPSLILVGSFLACLLRGDGDSGKAAERRFWAVVLLVGFCGVSIYGVRLLTKHRPENVERRVAAQVRDGDVIYSDGQTTSDIVFFRTGSLVPANATTLPWEGVAEAELQEGAYVLVRKDRTAFLKKHYDYEIPDFAMKQPSTWQSVWSDGEAELFRINRASADDQEAP